MFLVTLGQVIFVFPLNLYGLILFNSDELGS